MNPFFQTANQGNSQPNIMQQFEQFKQTFSGDPKAVIQQMVQTGRVNQDMLNRAQMMARQFGMLR